MEWIDSFLNKITMYRLTMDFLYCLFGWGVILSFFHVLPYNWIEMLASGIFLLLFGWLVNKIFGWAFDVPTNKESFYITALILALIIKPATNLHQYIFLAIATAVAMGSKFILAINKKHIFNPAALSVAFTAFAIHQSAVWWVGTKWMLPVVLIGGILIVRKIRHWDMVYTFLVVAIATTFFFGVARGSDIMLILKEAILVSPLFFFAFVMLSEPLTTPPTRGWQIIYGAIVGFLFSPFTHVSTFYFTPELALLSGNIFSYVVSPKYKFSLELVEKNRIGEDLYDFVFRSDHKVNFAPGQYMEWTLGHDKIDKRGNRRYFTVASSPTEDTVRLGVKFYSPASSFKKNLLELNLGQKIFAGQLAGDFTLPTDKNEKLIFLAGGIGITPYRSMLKYLIDNSDKRAIAMFFSNKSEQEIVYEDVLAEADRKLGIKTIFTLTDEKSASWTGEQGRIDQQMIAKYVPDYKKYTFYISGTHAMVDAMEDMLKQAGIPNRQIKTDFFPGFV